MKKIPTLSARDADGNLTDEYHPAADWVVRGEGVATRKWDGTAVMVRDGQVFARYDAKGGKPTPPDFIPCQDPDPITYHHPGWVPAVRPGDKWIRDAKENSPAVPDGTYEACGPKIGGNPEGLPGHVLIRHGEARLPDCPRDKAGLRAYFSEHDMEGVVWWRNLEDPDCDKVKITASSLDVVRPSHREQ